MFNSSFANRNLDSSHLLGESCNLLALGLGGIGEIAFILSAEPVLLHIQDWLGWKGTDFFIFFFSSLFQEWALHRTSISYTSKCLECLMAWIRW